MSAPLKVCAALILMFSGLLVSQARAYSVLSHEAIVDAAWAKRIEPLLRKRFPQTTAEQMREARAYAYGGCIIQDLGYYPFGSQLFSDLLHYVRSGDFVSELIGDAHDVNEYAFALGALAHYAADNLGHPAVNRAVALLYPKKRAAFGDSVTYAEYPAGHVQAEFSFDVFQTARGKYASDTFHDFIGFEVAEDLLERSFQKTYGFDLKDLFLQEDLAIGTYRWSIGTLIPQVTDAAVVYYRSQFDETHRFSFSQAEYEKQFGRKYRRPGCFSRILAFFLRLLPKVGFLRPLAFPEPTPEVEKLFVQSFQTSLDRYFALLDLASAGHPRIPNTNLDNGLPLVPGEYKYADRAFAALARRLADHPEAGRPVVESVLHYYADLNRSFDTEKHKGEWKKTLKAVHALRSRHAFGKTSTIP